MCSHRSHHLSDGPSIAATPQDAERLFHLLMQNVTEYAIFVLDPKGRVVQWNAGAERLFGYQAEEIVGKPFSILFAPEAQAQRLAERELRLANARGRAEDEHWALRKSGQRFWSSGIATALRDEQGRLQGFAVIVRDNTRRKRDEEERLRLLDRERQARREAETARQRLIAMLDSITDGFLAIDHAGRLTYANRRAVELSRRPLKKLLGKDVREVFPEAVDTIFYRECYRSLTQRVPIQIEAYYPPLNRWFEVHFCPTPEGLAAYVTDVTTRKIAEIELQTRERRRAALAQLGMRAMGAVDPDALFNEASQALAQVLEMEFVAIFELLPDGQTVRLRAGLGWRPGLVGQWTARAAEAAEIGDALRSKGPILVQRARGARRDGLALALLDQAIAAGASIRIEGRKGVFGVLAVYTTRPRTLSRDDLHVLEAVANILALFIERERSEGERARLLALERQARSGAEEARRRQELFMAVIAHDLRGPLTAIRGYAQLFRRFETLPKERRAQAVSTILSEVDRLGRLISDLLDFSRVVAGRLRIAPQPVDLVGLARQVVEAQQLTTTAHQIILEAPPRVQGMWDPDRLAQVLTNLISNAIKYSPEGGNVWVRLRPRDQEVEISVADQGMGLTTEERARLFEPFARLERTRSLKGAGLGLFIAKGIVEAHGGQIWAESAGPGKGSTFFVALPLRPPRRA